MLPNPLDQVRARAEGAALQLDDSLAVQVIKAEQLQEAYPEGLPIEISFWAAFWTGRINLIWREKRYWHPKKGLVVERSGVKGMPDHEEMPLQAIAAGVPPDIDYVWWIDNIRKVQSVWNFLLSWLLGQIPLMDLDGDLVLIAPGNAGNVRLELVREPKKTAELLKQFSQAMVTGPQAYQQLVGRADQRNQVRNPGSRQ